MPHDACIDHRAVFSFCFTLSRILMVNGHHFVTMYYSHPRRLARSPIAKQNLSHRANVICDGSPSRIRRVRRISFGMTIRPRSSMRLTMPVAFIYCSSTLCVRNHIAIVCKQWGIMRMEDKEGKGRARVGICRAEYGAFFRN